jgi:hypothetical protein
VILQELDVISSNIVVVLNRPEKPVPFSPSDLGKIVREPLNVTQALDGITIASPRDQIEITLAGGRLKVEDNSGQAPGKKKVVAVTHAMLQLFKTTYRAFGLNYRLTFRPEADKNPADVIANNLIDKDRIENNSKLQIMGGAATLFYNRGVKVCTLTIEPQAGLRGNKIIVDLNAHEDSSELPPVDELQKSFRREYLALIKILNSI